MAEKNKVLLIGPRILKVGKFPSSGLGYISSYLSARGCKVRIIDTNFTGECPYDAIRKAGLVRLVGISCESRNIKEALEIARYAKDMGNTVIMGGLHVSLIKEKILENSYVDYAIHGDGELSLFEFIRFLEGDISVSKVSGLIYRQGHEIIVNAKAGIDILDALPFPNYKLSGIHKIFDYPLITSRDCPYRCNFCTVGSISHGKWRYRTPENTKAFLCKEKLAYTVDLQQETRIPQKIAVSFKLKNNSILTGICGYYKVYLGKEHMFSTRPRKVNTSWAQFFLPCAEKKIIKRNSTLNFTLFPKKNPREWRFKFEII